MAEGVMALGFRTFRLRILYIVSICYVVLILLMGLRYIFSDEIQDGRAIAAQPDPMAYIQEQAKKDCERWNALMRDAYAKNPVGLKEALKERFEREGMHGMAQLVEAAFDPTWTEAPLQDFVDDLLRTYRAWLSFKKQMIALLFAGPLVLVLVLLATGLYWNYAATHWREPL